MIKMDQDMYFVLLMDNLKEMEIIIGIKLQDKPSIN